MTSVSAPIIKVLAALLLIVGCSRGASNQLHGHWVYASGESGGRSTSVGGDLKFTPDGKFDDSRRIGGIGGFRSGTYSVQGDRLTLTFDGGKGTQSYNFSFGANKDADGKPFETLLLRSTDLSFILTRKEKK